jgi:hypothetical protein
MYQEETSSLYGLDQQYFTHTKRSIVDEWFEKKWAVFWERCQLVSSMALSHDRNLPHHSHKPP